MEMESYDHGVGVPSWIELLRVGVVLADVRIAW
jgi:hypothetical protein